ncbi:hypothetical protein HPB49_013184 [Dermacentor silvarum]|uniref:Uncharacterized protein n=1 Tax=Dermacentor silvarum TaxID=543639 RepID=A0ACB8C3S8_DERSI|nr:hypothetical protein HPB49_013184 [Dermacentor silvarum]
MTSTFKPCLVSSSASEPNVGRVASSKPDTSTNTLDGSGLKHVKFSNGVESRVPPAAQNRGESRAVVGGSLPRVIHADPKVHAGSSAIEAKIPEPRPPPPSRSQESVCSIASRGSSNPPTPVERKGRRRAPTPPKAPPPDPPRPKTAPPKPPAAAAHSQKPPEAPRKHPSSKPPAPPIPTVKSPTREAAPRPTEKEAPVEAMPVRPPRLPSPPKDDPKDSERTPKEPMAVTSPEMNSEMPTLHTAQYAETSGISMMETEMCDTKACKDKAKLILDNMDKNGNPCDDFYAYACGSYLKRSTIDSRTPSPVDQLQMKIASDMSGTTTVL